MEPSQPPRRPSGPPPAAAPGTPSGTVAGTVALWLVVATAVFLRFYRLDAPYLWADEMYSVLSAVKPLDLLLRSTLSISDNSPYFYLLLKAVSACGFSDFALRFPFALAGVATVYALYRVVAPRLGQAAALAAAGYLAVSPYHIWASRQTRPYVLMLPLFVWALELLAAGLADRARFRPWALALANAGLMALHYLGLLVVAAEGVAVAAFALGDLRRRWRTAAWFAGASLVGALPVLPFLVSFLGRKEAGLQADTLAAAAETALSAVALVASPTGTLAGFWPFAAVAAVGAWRLARRDARLAALLGLVVAVPVAALLVMRSGRTVWPIYFLFMLGPAAMVFGAALGTRGRWRAPAALVVAVATLAAGGAFFARHRADFYEGVNGYAAAIFHFASFKDVARKLPALIDASQLTTVSESLFREGVSWYLDRFTTPNPLVRQGLAPGETVGRFNFLTSGNDFAHLGHDEAEVFARLGRPERVVRDREFTLYTFAYPRQDALRVEATPFTAVLGTDPGAVCRQAHALRDLAIHPFWGYGLVATRRGQPGSLEYVLENQAAGDRHSIQVWFRFANEAPGNRLRCEYAFDDEAPVALLESLGKDPRSAFAATIRRDRPYRRLAIRFLLRVDTDEERPNLAVLRTLQLKETRLAVCAADEESDCAQWLYTSTLPQGFVDTALPGQRTLGEDNLAVEPADAAGFATVSPVDAGRPGSLTVAVGAAGPGTLFFPRLCGPNASLQVLRQEPDGGFRELFAMKSPPSGCTPVGLQCPLDLGPAGQADSVLRFMLYGRGAQLARRQGDVLFHLGSQAGQAALSKP